MAVSSIFNVTFFTLALLLVLACTISMPSEARSLHGSSTEPVRDRMTTLLGSSDVLDDPTCWDSLMELSACTGEVIMFFLNGETYLGPSCCEAIRTIDSRCSPLLMRTLLGYTTEEGDVLDSYCIEEGSTRQPTVLKANNKVVPRGGTTLGTSIP